ncbi:MAG: hypothetical protein CMJ47_04895 [Planctomyces sp.]|nr:hypothetical protein [Planctomyces sp.]
MKSPFAIFRKHQKVLMVVLTGLAMFAFVILDSLSQNMALIPPVFGFGVGLAIAWALTRNMQYSTAWMLVGAIVGTVLGSQLQATTAASEAVVETSFGAVSEEDLAEVNNRQQMVNGFLIEAFRTAHEGDENANSFQLQQALFGGNGDPNREALMHLLMLEEAKEIGLDISQTQVKAYIDRVTSNKLSGRAFREITSRIGLSGEDLFDLLREQMVAREARAVLMPTLLTSPDDYWTAYQKLNVRQELTVVPIAAESFLDAVPKPSEDELKAMFEEYKDVFPNEKEPGAPGFRQPVRVKLGYLEVDYDQVASTIPEVTDEEVAAYYEANKEQFRNDVTPAFPNEQPGMEEAEQPAESEAPAGNGPALMAPGSNNAEAGAESAETPTKEEAPADKPEADKPVASPENKPAAEDEKAPTEMPADAPAKAEGEDKPAAPAEKPEEKSAPPKEGEGSESPEEGSDGNEQSSLMSRPLGRAFASIQQPAPEKGSEPAAAEESEEKPEAEAPKAEDKPEAKPEEPAKEETPAKAEEKPAAEGDSAEKKEEPKPETSDKPAEPTATAEGDSEPAEEPMQEEPLPEFRELDDALKAEIAKQLKDDKTLQKMAEMASQARGDMISINAKYAVAPEGEQAAAAEEIRKEAQAYAKANGLRYVETPLLSPSELEESEDHPIGGATEPVANPFERTEANTVVDQHFSVNNIDELARQKYRLFEAEDPSTLNRFVHWQVDYRASHVPTWDEEGVQEQVRETWRNTKAQELAKKRAEEVLKMLKESDKPWSETLEGVTETGKEGSQTLVVSYTGPFSWLTRSSAPQTNPFAPPPMEITQIPIIFGGVDQTFMKTVFFDLSPGELGTVWGADHRYVYVVKPENRTEAETVRQDFMGPQANLFSFMSPYEMLARADTREVARLWLDSVYERYEVKWKDEEGESAE